MLFFLFFLKIITHGIFSLYSLGTNGFAMIPGIFYINISAADSILRKILTKIWTRSACRNANEIITLTCDFLWSLGQVTNLTVNVFCHALTEHCYSMLLTWVCSNSGFQQYHVSQMYWTISRKEELVNWNQNPNRFALHSAADFMSSGTICFTLTA